MTSSTHERVRRRFAAFRAGLLDEADENALREHVETCGSCREALAQFDQGSDPFSSPDGHIPADLLGVWGRARVSLRGLERQMVQSHLEACAECRQDLEILGFEPVLGELPGLAPALVPLVKRPASPAENFAPVDRERPILRIVTSPKPARGWPMMSFGGFLGAAAAVCTLMARPELVAWRLPGPAAPNVAVIPESSGPSESGAPAPAGDSPGSLIVPPPDIVPDLPPTPAESQAQPVALDPAPRGARITLVTRVQPERTQVRGGDPAGLNAIVTPVPESCRMLALRLPMPPEWPGDTRVVVRFISPSDRVVAEESHLLKELPDGTAMVVDLGDSRPASGIYRLRIEKADSADSVDAPELKFNIQFDRR